MLAEILPKIAGVEREGDKLRAEADKVCVAEKTCSRCSEMKPISAFSKRRGGWHSWCRDCQHRYSRELYAKTHGPIQGWRLCACGCGQKTAVARRNMRREGVLKGQPRRFVKGHHLRLRGQANHAWRGGTFTHKGYVYVFAHEHPHPTQGRYVKRSRLIMEYLLGRYLLSSEQVHHINNIRDDDRSENLELVSLAEHNRIHDRAKLMREAKARC